MHQRRYKIKQPELASKVFQNPSYFLAFGFGSGLLPWVPGTWGSIAAIPLYCLLCHLSIWLYPIVVLVWFVLGIIICGQVATDLAIHDFGGIVWDEIVGMLITLYLVPWHWVWLGIGLVLFRIFDVLKPWPIRWVDKHVNGGLGIMLDDVLAGVCSWAVLQMIIVVVHHSMSVVR